MSESNPQIKAEMCLRCGNNMEAGQPTDLFLGTRMHLDCIAQLQDAIPNKTVETPQEVVQKTPPRKAQAARSEPRGTVHVEPGVWRTLSDRQLSNIEVYSYYLHGGDIAITPKNVFDHWSIEPDHVARYGERPSEEKIASYMASNQYKGNMERWGISNTSALSTEQVLALRLITDTTDKRSISKKLRSIGVDPKKYQTWTKNPAFAEHIKKLTDHSLQFSVEIGKIALAQKVEEGDLASIKYLNEMTGFFNPNDTAKTAENLTEMLQIVLEEVQRAIQDPAKLQEIQTNISLRSNAMRAGVIKQVT